MKHFTSIVEMNRYNGIPAPEHPLLGIIRCNRACNTTDQPFTTDCYMIGFKKLRSGIVRYGRTQYDHDTGSMSFVKPRQMIQFTDLEFEEDGFLIYVHEDYLNGHVLHEQIAQYSFFDYDINEALHLSPREERLMWDLFAKIDTEYRDNPDEYSRDIILTHLDSMLKYSQRFYKRQFINRTELSGNTVSKFQKALERYSQKELSHDSGLPTVTALANELNLSSRYLSDLLKQETGKTAIELIHIHLIGQAKNLITAKGSNISEVAYRLGFENLPYFSRLFKKQTGQTPIGFRKQLGQKGLLN